MLNLETILEKCGEAKVEEIDVPAWGDKVYMRSMSGTSRDKLEEKWQSIEKGGSMAGLRAMLVGACLCDKNGVPHNPNAAQLVRIGQAPSDILDKLGEHARRLSGLGVEDLEEAEKN